jgi:hypothetical protein
MDTDQIRARYDAEVMGPLGKRYTALAHANLDQLIIDVMIEATNNRHVPEYIRDRLDLTISLWADTRSLIRYKGKESFGTDRRTNDETPDNAPDGRIGSPVHGSPDDDGGLQSPVERLGGDLGPVYQQWLAGTGPDSGLGGDNAGEPSGLSVSERFVYDEIQSLRSHLARTLIDSWADDTEEITED